MAAKRALIVDDSRSARVILGRMLEAHGLQVDAAESAEQALEYLRGARPDVIFMDHLMPGMDGFEAVKEIKANPHTASIPVMMYTSQEGEAYVREARALGAVGVLSKTLMSTDVSRALYQLRLLPDRRDTRAAESVDAPKATSSIQTHAPLAQPTSAPMRESANDLRRFLETSLDQAARRISNELRSALQAPAPEPPHRLRSSAPRGLIAALILFALVPTVVVGLTLWRMIDTDRTQLEQANARLAVVVAEQQTQIEMLRAELRKRETADTSPANASDEAVPVVYGEPPLSGARVEHLKRVFERLRAEGFKGKVRVTYFSGDFCLVGNPANGYTLASADLPQRRCDLIGSPYDDGLSAKQQQSAEYAALVNATTQSTHGDIQVITANGGRRLSVPYPPQSDTLTAGEWNRIAERNHRIEIFLEPAT